MEIGLPEAPGDQSVFFLRDLGEVGDYLFGTSRFAGHMALGPVVELNKAGVREYSEVNTGDYWNMRQVRDQTKTPSITFNVYSLGIFSANCNRELHLARGY